MPYAHFLVPAEGGDTEQRLREFLRQRAVLKIEQRFVDRPEGAMDSSTIGSRKSGCKTFPN